MMNPYKTTLVLTFIFISQLLLGNNRDVKVPLLSEKSRISLLTVGRNDDEIYQNFGHTAIRIKDTILGWDLVYNYGTFNFGEPGFLDKFIRGKLMYYESIDNYPDFEQEYREENRWIREQPFDLTQEQKQLLFDRLTINAREENKYYKYDFLFDNCSTRPRNMIFSIFTKTQYKPDADDKTSYRQLINRNVPDQWLDLGMNLLIGTPTDKKAKIGRTFLPYELMQLCDSAIVDGRPLVSNNNLVLDVVPQDHPQNWITPTLVFWLFFFLVLIVQIKTGLFSRFKILPVIYFTILGLFGWLFVFMWFGTDHLTTKWNLNILWAMPLNIPVLFFALKKQLPAWVLTYIKIYRILLIVLLVGWWANPQTYHTSVIPLILTAILFTSIFLPVPTQEDFKRRLFG